MNLCAFDTETTGVDPERDRIVTAAVIHVSNAGVTRQTEWLINPGLPIPESATAVHGITNERAQAEGVAPVDAVPHIATELLAAWAIGTSVVVMSAPFDLTLLNAELDRVAHEPLTVGPVLDPLCLDRALNRYRKGKRNLTALAEAYGVKQDTAHSCTGDALTAARVVWKQLAMNPQLKSMPAEELQAFQAQAHAAWADNYEAFLKTQGKPQSIDRRWPCR